MIVFFSGSNSKDGVPEALIAEKEPALMLTFHDCFVNSRHTMLRFALHQQGRKRKESKFKDKPVLNYNRDRRK